VWSPPQIITVGILSKAWPMWLLALSSLPCAITQVWVHLPNPSWLQVLQSCYPRITFTYGTPSVLGNETLLFLEGSNIWLQSILPTLPGSIPLVASTSLSLSMLPPNLQEFQLPSESAGSVVSGMWSFFSRGFGQQVPELHGYPRYLKHILNPTERLPARRSASQSDDALSSTAHLPKLQVLSAVHCPSAFVPHQPITRCLLAMELGRAFDILSPVLQCFASTTVRALPWLTSPPMKLAHAVASFYLGCVSGGVSSFIELLLGLKS